MANRRRSVLVLSDQVLFRQTLAAVLREEGLQVTEQLTTAPIRKRTDVAVVDLVHATTDTYVLVETLHEALGDTSLILVGSATRIAASTDGHADVEVDIGKTDLPTLVGVVRGRPPTQSSDLVRTHRTWAQVTPRQREVLRWLAAGLDNPGIAAKLRVGTRAIKAHISALLALFGFDSRTQLALCAHAGGLQPLK